MEAQTALVGADGGVVLHAVAAVDLNIAVIIHPGDPELNDALGLHKALQQRVLLPLGMLVDHEFQRFEHFPHGLQKFRLMSVTLLDLCINPFQILVRQHSDLLRRPYNNPYAPRFPGPFRAEYNTVMWAIQAGYL